MSSGLVGHWKFNEKSGTVANDSSRYHNTGTLVGSPKWGEKGIIFDGVDDYIDCGNGNNLNLISTLTLSVWVYASSSESGYILGKTATGLSNSGYGIYYIGSSSFMSSIATNPQITSTQFNIFNQWFHAVFTFDGTNGTWFKNGIIANTPTATSIPTTPTTNLYLGSRQNGTGASIYFAGSMDDVRIYNRALSQLEIKRLYNSTKHKYI